MGIQPIESRARGCAGGSAPDRGGMKAALMHAAWLQFVHQSPDLIAGDVRREGIKTIRPERPAFGQNSRSQNRAWMAIHADIVVVENVRRRAGAQRRIGATEITT